MIRNSKKPRPCGVYNIPCSCRKRYTGQTGRLTYTKIAEHVKNMTIDNLAVPEHVFVTPHEIKYDLKYTTIGNNNNRNIKLIKRPEHVKKEGLASCVIL